MADKRRSSPASSSKPVPQLTRQPSRAPRKSTTPRKISKNANNDSEDEMPTLEMQVCLGSDMLEADAANSQGTNASSMSESGRPKRSRKSVERYSAGNDNRITAEAAPAEDVLVKTKFPTDRSRSTERAEVQPLAKHILNDDGPVGMRIVLEEVDTDEEIKEEPDILMEENGSEEMKVQITAEEGVNAKPKRKYKKRRAPIYSEKHERNYRRMRQKIVEWQQRESRNENVNKQVRQKKPKRDLTLPRNREDMPLTLREKPKIDYSKHRVEVAPAPAPSPQSELARLQKIKWGSKDKRLLEEVLRSHHPDDIDAIHQYIPHKTKAEIGAYMTYLKTKPVDPSMQETIPDFVAPIDKWTSFCADLVRGHTDYAGYLSLLMTMCADMRPESDIDAHYRPVNIRRPNYKDIYHYLSCVLDKIKPPELGPYESAVVVDLLQTLAYTIGGADVTSQTEAMTNKYSLLTRSVTSDGVAENFCVRRARARQGWSSECGALVVFP